MKQLLIFVLLSGMLCWLMFSPLYKHVLIVRQATLQQEVDLLLELGTNASHGYISINMIDNSRQRLAERGFDIADLIYSVHTTSGVNGMDVSNPVLRGDGIQLIISYPYSDLLNIDRLMGMTIPSSEARISAAGIKMSEFVP